MSHKSNNLCKYFISIDRRKKKTKSKGFCTLCGRCKQVLLTNTCNKSFTHYLLYRFIFFRSSTLVLAYLMKYQQLSLVDAHTLVKSKRNMIRPNNGFWIQLIDYEKKLFGKNTVTMVPTPLGIMPNIYEAEVRNMVW